jgi:hypothetical protein
MRVAIKKERGVLKITLQYDTGKKPAEIELNATDAQSLITMLSMAAKADSFEFTYEVR